MLAVLLLMSFSVAHTQMWNGVDTLYGNEWIDYNKTYFSIKVAEDGIYRIDFQALSAAGLPVGTITGSQFRLYRYGREESIFSSSNGIFSTQDFIEFYGEKNRGQVDYFLFDDPNSEQINPLHSIFNDTTVYYLFWETSGQGLRYIPLQNDLNNLPPKLPYCWSSVLQMPAAGAFKKKVDDEVTYSWFDGVGYTSSGSASESPLAFTLPGIYAQGPPAQMQVRYAANLDQHHKRILFNDTLYAEDQFFNYKLLEHNFAVPASRLTVSSNLKITSPIGDRHGLAFARIRYARDFNFAGNSALFSLDANLSEQYLEIQGFDVSAGAPVLYDLTNKKRLLATVNGNLLQIKLPASSVERQLLLINPAGIKPVPALQSVQFQDLGSGAADYVIISNKKLFNDPSAGGANRVAEYAAYRSSAAGGNLGVKVLDVEDLYAQFAYGVRFHPIAIRNFLHWAKRRWPGLDHALIIGKALDFQNFRTSSAQSTLIDSLFFVPNFSTPGADLPFTMQGNRLTDPIMGIGRLAVTKPQEIYDYLQKVIQHEQQIANAEQTIAGKAWMKRVIHNSGGLSGESGLIKNYTAILANTLETNRFGADVHSFYKTSNDPIQLSAYKQLLDLINSGVSLWTIFGHSSAFAVDFDIGLPSAYDNFGRYPLMMILGCFSGICSAPQKGIGEEFVLAPNRGAIAYIASVNYSFIDALQTYGQQYYSRMGGLDYGNSVGLTLAHTVRDLKSSSNRGLIAVLHQNLLQGDPAIRVHAHDGPDYVIDNQSFTANPNPVSIQENNFKLGFEVLNIGENVGGQLELKMEQRLPDNTTVLLRQVDTIDAPAFRRKLEYPLSLTGSKLGFNRFFISLDPENKVAESPSAAEWNNSLLDAGGLPGQDVFFYADDVLPVYPPNFGIVGNPSPTLFASTLNSNAAVYRYLFEIDTLETFDSPLKKATQITERGGLLSWKPGIPLTDSVVYYWRVARDSLVNGLPLWRTQSFMHLPNSAPGWHQSHFGQYQMNEFVNLSANTTERKIEFQDNAAFVNLQVAYRGVNRYPGFKNAYYQGFYGDYGWGQQGIFRGVALMVLDENSGRAMINPENGPYNYSPQKEREFFWFDTKDSLQRLKLMDFLENAVPAGFYVGLLAFNSPSDAIGYAPHLWAKDSVSQGKNLFQVLESQGAKKVRELKDFNTAPPAYGFVFRKGHPEYANRDTIVRNTDATVELRADFLAKWPLGFMESPVIGPVKAWESLHWRHDDFDDSSDLASLSVLAVQDGQEDSLLLSLHSKFDTSLSVIPAAQFPRLKLRYQVSDTLTRSATSLRYARILYEALPEAALHPLARFNFYNDTLQQGDFMRCGLAFANISETPFDSVLVRFKVENQQNTGFEVQKRLRPLLPGDTLIAELSASTRTLSGPQRLLIEANPLADQPELYHFNNVYLQDFYVQKDLRNPLLDVTFDGQHILNGDIISPKPIVQISLKDENPFLAMRDSNTISLKLIKPDGSSQTIPSNDPNISFFPADPSNLPKKNLARIEWRPVFSEDGEYRLLVNGIDASGNESAALDWSVTFNIITKSSLSSLLNYPNPFSTSTCFVYTLTGTESPTHFRIQIMTVAGRVVRDITEREFGPLLPGVHQSDFCWDGKDAFGDQLANGVYLYRIVAKKADGTDFEHFENQSADGFFKHGFGKMVLMR